MVPAAIDVRRFPHHVPLGCRPVIAMSTVTSASVVLLSNPFPRLPEPERPACPAVACDRLVDVGTASSWGCGGRSGRCRFARPCLGVFPHRRRPSRRCLPAYAGPPPALARLSSSGHLASAGSDSAAGHQLLLQAALRCDRARPGPSYPRCSPGTFTSVLWAVSTASSRPLRRSNFPLRIQSQTGAYRYGVTVFCISCRNRPTSCGWMNVGSTRLDVGMSVPT